MDVHARGQSQPGIRHHAISHLVSILDDMIAAATKAAESDDPFEWRIGANAWHAFLADLHHRDLWNVREDQDGPPGFLAYPIVRVLDARQPTGWALVSARKLPR